MKTVYLKNGQKCLLHEELPKGKFLVEEYLYYNGHGDEEDFEDLSGHQIVVYEIFDKAPIAVLDKEYGEKENLLDHLSTQIADLKSEEYKLKFSIQQLTKTQIDKEKFIIDRSEFLKAKEIVVFISDRIMPKRISGEKYGWKINLQISMRNGEERAWYYNLYHDDDRFSYSEYMCQEDKMLFDPTEEEVDAIIMKRLSKAGSDFNKMINVPEKYLNEEQKKGIAEYRLKEKEKRIKSIESEIENKRAVLQKLKSED